jgi:hypothetical protein
VNSLVVFGHCKNWPNRLFRWCNCRDKTESTNLKKISYNTIAHTLQSVMFIVPQPYAIGFQDLVYIVCSIQCRTKFLKKQGVRRLNGSKQSNKGCIEVAQL